MVLSPDQIADKRFVITFRGYDQPEVEVFLRAVADDYRRLSEELDHLRHGTGESQDPFRRLQVDLDGVLAAAKEAAQNLVDQATLEADRKLQQAQSEARAILEAATRQRDAVLEEANRTADSVRTHATEQAAAITASAAADRDRLVGEARAALDRSSRLAAELRDEVAHLGSQVLQQVNALTAQWQERATADAELVASCTSVSEEVAVAEDPVVADGLTTGNESAAPSPLTEGAEPDEPATPGDRARVWPSELQGESAL